MPPPSLRRRSHRLAWVPRASPQEPAFPRSRLGMELLELETVDRREKTDALSSSLLGGGFRVLLLVE